MKPGEKLVLWLIVLLLVIGVAQWLWQKPDPHRREIPFYSTAPHEVTVAASDLYRKYQCRECHTLWADRDILENVPAPMLDGIGSLRSEAWLYAYLSAPHPQSILPSRVKAEYQMPSYASLPEAERRVMAEYLGSLKVKDWYLAETKKSEYEKLTGRTDPSE